ncbi:MAG: hypothetical protein SGPRY_009819 [Prymnesium sp.]
MQEPQGINFNNKRGCKECTAPLPIFRAMLAKLLKGEIRAGLLLLLVQLEKAAMVKRKSKMPQNFEARR